MIYIRKWGDKWYKNLIAFSISNPFKTWWKAKKYFKKPHTTIKFVNNKFHFPYASKYWQGKLLDINIHDVLWKDKYNSPRHERNPLIYICLFGKYSIWIYPTITYYNEFGEKENGDMYYWEYLLDYLYYSKNQSLICYSAWTSDSKLYRTRIYGNSEDGSKDKIEAMRMVVPCVALSLNKDGIKKLKKELKSKN